MYVRLEALKGSETISTEPSSERFAVSSLPVRIAGVGSYLPEHIISNSSLEQMLGLSAGWIAKRTGVHSRHRALDESASEMAARAAQIALERAAWCTQDIDLIIAASSTPQQAIPCTAALIQRELASGDGKSACFDVNATCISFLVGLDTAARLISGGLARRALICSSEITSHSLNPAEPESASLFGDGAAAVLLEHSDTSRYYGMALETHASGADLTRIQGGGTLHHPNNPSSTLEMNFFSMRGPQVFRYTARLFGSFLERFLARIDWTQSDVDVVVPHQASGPALQLLTSTFGFREDQILHNIEMLGNCVAASIPLALVQGVENGRIKRGNRVLFLGTAAGITLGAAALDF